jgi:hypothetical protein
VEAKDLISSLLTVDPAERISAKAALAHPWINLSDEELAGHNLDGTIAEIKKFNARGKLKGTIRAVMAATKMKMLLASLTQASKKVAEEAAAKEEEDADAAGGAAPAQVVEVVTTAEPASAAVGVVQPDSLAI